MEKKAGFYMPLFILCSGDKLRDRESEGESRKKEPKGRVTPCSYLIPELVVQRINEQK